MPIITSFDDVLQAALRLPANDRAVLAERLLASLDDLDEHESDRLWGEEAERRLAAYRDGTAGARPAEEVYARAGRLSSD
jgi:putative addiction module component (TIGR02574 family)